MSAFTSEWRAHDGLNWLHWGGAGVEAAFPTRGGGVSAGPYAALNLGLAVGDDPAAVLENRRRLGAAIGLDLGRWAVPSQVHGTQLVEVGEADAGRGARDLTSTVAETDALLTAAAGLGLAVSHADCVPVVIAAAGPEGPVLAAVHAGWRGMLDGIVESAGAALAGRARPLAAVVGPSIGPCCFTVDDALRRRFDARFPGVASAAAVDLWECAARQLRAAGVPAGEITLTGLCTSCDRRFFSHRRDKGLTGRHLTLAWRADRAAAADGES
jgi:hypothetical protein